MNRTPMMVAFWQTFAKAQAHALKAEVHAQGHELSVGHALETRAHLADTQSWNHYTHALRTGAAPVNTLLGLEDRLQRSLCRWQIALTLDAAQHVLQMMEAAGGAVLQAALQAVKDQVRLYSVTGTVLNVHVLAEQLAMVDEQEVLADLEQARPHIGALNDEPELIALLVSLCEHEGPGFLVALGTFNNLTWAYLPDERHALCFALAKTALPELVSTRDEPSLDLRWNQALMRRMTLPPVAVPDPARALSRRPDAERWVKLWNHREGLEERLSQLEARLPLGFPGQTGLPAALNALEAHLAFWDGLEATALRARRMPAPSLEWSTALDEGTLKALHHALDREVQAVISGTRSRFPEAAHADIRAALEAGLSLPHIVSELQVLLEDEQWHARRRMWEELHDLRQVFVGDTLCVDGGQPFQVQAVRGLRYFTLSVVDHDGSPREIRDTQRLERLLPSAL
ncbi:hypothetical protein [Deinococcus aquatilis]|uniref:hypothetical protein n=1 Tax=Deinococcus aquatilis TaxID=519440 RepID=UPI000362E1E7|nr:hypothetical protein [Deinococcus aquatilis]